ncbi:outer membrane protein OmpA-like peptidoglycan-associated protein [Hymenobacter luteus]|uniref:Outer membrane protein OmpA-like peptidoglycan-associated protein n=2 Tax=Hymenobacter TaxID=89966 RepID=A0A7W9T330_9BACT|nr:MULTISPECIES: OmpA family protein [Hymenobacter]MBB4601733.1 outer membrane protein OmpA-like peptidoglycan-associated protein [Hymenobacter latericoloratus]MBB6059838.1 outer membrane protein OmpA-like peptidoglycan-associated protein [Hymenobacter luteus]
MKVLLTLVLALCWLTLRAQEAGALRVYSDPGAQYQLAYPAAWQLVRPQNDSSGVTLLAAEPPGRVLATVSRRPLPELQGGATGWAARSQLDSVWHATQRLPQAQVLQLALHEADTYAEVRYHYTYAAGPAPAPRTRVVGRRMWQRGQELRLEYRASTSLDASYLADADKLVASLRFTGPARPATGGLPAQCDDKMYGIAALRYDNELWEDDCRTIHEFAAADLSAPPRIHRQVLPFQSYALAKGFDNCLYSVTKSPTDAPEPVYRYNPATGQGEFTSWLLPPQGPENVWISAATDEQGSLYFMTSDASKLVKVAPATGAVSVVWATDPVRQAPFYPTIGFAGAGSHGNFCLDEAQTLYQVYSTDGSLISVNLSTGQPAPTLTVPAGLPRRGGYSDLLLQKAPDGRRWLYMAGPKALYRVDMSRGEAQLVRRGIYTDLAGCNVFRQPPPLPPPTREAVPAPPVTGTWRGRVLDARTFQPLPQARLRLGPAGAETTVPLNAQGMFSFLVEPGRKAAAQAWLAGYLPLDSTFSTSAGPYVQDILLQPLAVGTILRLDKVRFEQGSARLLSSSYPALKKLLQLLTDTPGLTIELRGHTDNVGAPEKNVQLSERRVATVKAYLVRHGIAESRITGLGLGGAEPRASNDWEATRQLNRRVEFRVTGV